MERRQQDRSSSAGKHYRDQLTAATDGAANLLQKDVQERWKTLVSLIDEYSVLPLVTSHLNESTGQYDLPTGQDLVDQLAEGRVTGDALRRAENDVYAYADYVRRALIGVIDGTPIPPDRHPPVLNRQDSAVWSWPERDL